MQELFTGVFKTKFFKLPLVVNIKPGDIEDT